MDVGRPLRAHAQWVAQLREMLYGHGALTVEMAIADDECELGQWLKRREPIYAGVSAFHEVKEIHSRFHRRAALCLRLAAAGRRAEAIAETEGEGELRRLSRLLVKSFHVLQRFVATSAAGGVLSSLSPTSAIRDLQASGATWRT